MVGRVLFIDKTPLFPNLFQNVQRAELHGITSMTINEFNNTIKEKLQIDRDSKMPYQEYLRNFFKFYRDMVSNNVNADFVSKYLPSTTNIDTIKKEILNTTNALLRAYNAYSEGKISTAITIMKNRFLDTERSEMSMRSLELDHSLYWYRARKLTKSNRHFQPKEMFHIPFEKRTEVVNYRYSISGYPCLYLGKTILSCWEEMGTPALDDLAISRLQVANGSKIKVFDLRIPSEITLTSLSEGPMEARGKKQNLDLLLTWPLIISCTIKSITPDASFKHEYVHSQLLMLALIENSNYYGVAYTSTHMDKNMSSNEDDYCNVAIPVKKVKAKGICSTLSSIFKLTRGVPLMEMDIKNVFNESPIVTDGCLSIPDPTSHTKFEQAERWMDRISLESIN